MGFAVGLQPDGQMESGKTVRWFGECPARLRVRRAHWPAKFTAGIYDALAGSCSPRLPAERTSSPICRCVNIDGAAVRNERFRAMLPSRIDAAISQDARASAQAFTKVRWKRLWKLNSRMTQMFSVMRSRWEARVSTTPRMIPRMAWVVPACCNSTRRASASALGRSAYPHRWLREDRRRFRL